MHEDDIARRCLHERIEYGFGTRASPVVGVDVPTDLGCGEFAKDAGRVLAQVPTGNTDDVACLFACCLTYRFKSLGYLFALLVISHVIQIDALT